MSKRKDLVVVTIKSDEIDENMIKQVKKQLKNAWKGRKVAVFGIGSKDSIDIKILKR